MYFSLYSSSYSYTEVVLHPPQKDNQTWQEMQQLFQQLLADRQKGLMRRLAQVAKVTDELNSENIVTQAENLNRILN